MTPRRIRQAHPSRRNAAKRTARTWRRILATGRRPMTESIRRMTRPDRLWYHPNHSPESWQALRAMFASVGGITVARAILLGWSTDPANGSRDTANPVNVMLGG